jgi:hypothetical protein
VAALGSSLVSAIFFAVLMWQVRILLNHARTDQRLLAGIATSLHRIAWLAILWPITSTLVQAGFALAHALRHARPGAYQFTFRPSFDFPLVFVGVVLLLVRSVIERLRSYYDEMQLVV